MPRRNPLQVAIAILLVVIVVVVIVVFVAGCTEVEPTTPVTPANQQSVVLSDGDTAEMELIGCVKGVCTYTFHHVRRCFLSIGVYGIRFDTWMFDLECPG